MAQQRGSEASRVTPFPSTPQVLTKQRTGHEKDSVSTKDDFVVLCRLLFVVWSYDEFFL